MQFSNSIPTESKLIIIIFQKPRTTESYNIDISEWVNLSSHLASTVILNINQTKRKMTRCFLKGLLLKGAVLVSIIGNSMTPDVLDFTMPMLLVLH